MSTFQRSQIRQQVINSSPEIRQLESQLRNLANKKENDALIAEKHLFNRKNQEINQHYANLTKLLGEEERRCIQLEKEQEQISKNSHNLALKAQIAEKQALKAKEEASNTLDLMLIDKHNTIGEDIQDKKEERERIKSHTLQVLNLQLQLKCLKEEEYKINEQRDIKSAEYYNHLKNIQKEIEYQKQEYSKLALNLREYSMVKKLEQQQNDVHLMKELRTEIDRLEFEFKLKQKMEQENKHRQEKRYETAAAYSLQIQEKNRLQEQETRNEKLFMEMLMKIQAEESKLDQLTRETKKRRRQDHHILANKLLEERRCMRAMLKLNEEQELHKLEKHHKLRDDIIAEEERKLLLKHAPHLMAFYTPDLMKKLSL